MGLKTIQFDVDGVLAEFVLEFSRLGNLIFGSPVKTYPEMNFINDFCLEPDQLRTLWSHIETMPNFWKGIEPMTSRLVFDQIDALGYSNHVVFVTNRYVGTPCPQYQTAQWLESHGIYFPTVVIAKDKARIATAIGANFSLEDNLDNANAIAETGCRSFLINHKYNQGRDTAGNITRIDTVSEFLEEIR